MATGRLFKWSLPIVSVGGSAIGYRFFASNNQGDTLILPDALLNVQHVTNSEREANPDSVVTFNEPQSDSSEVNSTSVESTPDVPFSPELKQTQLSQISQHFEPKVMSEEDRQRIIKEGEEALKKIDDYTFRIFSPCGVGTGWVLDYQIPKNPNEYPTVWYIATNAHVIKDFRFSTNDYNQKIHVSVDSTRAIRKKYEGYRFNYYTYKLWDGPTCIPVDWWGYFDISLHKQSNGETSTADSGMVHNWIIEEPKLFYVAIDFLERDDSLDVPENNYKDFAVLEIKFKNSADARKYTGGFADNYGVDTTKAINIFADPLEQRYDTKGLEEMEENFYNLGYPSEFRGQREKLNHNNNFNKNTAKAARLSRQAEVKGLVSTKGIGKADWAGITKSKVGNFYVVEQDPEYHLLKGSSGSMFTDKDGNLLGIKSMGSPSHSYLVPLRSNKIERSKWGGLVSPEYDLIVGGKARQKTSYKDQVTEYILKKGGKTWLSERNWKNEPKQKVS